VTDTTATVYLSLGSNLGDRRANLITALNTLKQNVRIIKISAVYDTAPMENTNQGRFLNIAIEATTALTPRELLKFVKGIEWRMGRNLKAAPNSPRPIDIDILFYGDTIINAPALVIPHPRLHLREFVLAPLAEIAPDFVHPVLNKTIRELQIELGETQDVNRLEGVQLNV